MIYLAFIFGLIFGSFLNVVIYRLNPALQLKSGVFGRSACLYCRTQLKWSDLIPLFSFIWLRRHCRYCDKKISWQYPIVEILSGLVWVGVFYKIYGFNFSAIGEISSLWGGQFLNFLNFFYYIFILSSFLVVAVYDYKWQIIPDKLVFPAIIIVIIYSLFNKNFIMPIIVSSVAFLFFFLIFYFSKGQAMGFGDAKLAFLIGLFLNPLLAGIAFTLAFVLGAIFGIILVCFRKKSWKSQIAFGPFLVIGTMIAFFMPNFLNINLIF